MNSISMKSNAFSCLFLLIKRYVSLSLFLFLLVKSVVLGDCVFISLMCLLFHSGFSWAENLWRFFGLLLDYGMLREEI